MAYAIELPNGMYLTELKRNVIYDIKLHRRNGTSRTALLSHATQ